MSSSNGSCNNPFFTFIFYLHHLLQLMCNFFISNVIVYFNSSYHTHPIANSRCHIYFIMTHLFHNANFFLFQLT
ncbi:hypothetical protein DPEC_G00356720 [Dallia pectoralis]|uniref:Uncharacterized protein n=1 Tax=Dallia pectoralis TaxID=75939 RepID=A0ACC2EZW2_DALPE|nr:hypothetical protein DPEC_G00356720 [Dallia pectoralis]